MQMGTRRPSLGDIIHQYNIDWQALDQVLMRILYIRIFIKPLQSINMWGALFDRCQPDRWLGARTSGIDLSEAFQFGMQRRHMHVQQLLRPATGVQQVQAACRQAAWVLARQAR